jgi:ABC-type Na+ efflux pump permease subunit
MHTPTLFRDRSRPIQVILGGVVPVAIGAVAGIMVGIAAGAYYAVGILAAVGGVLAGLEHRDGWGGADRGLVGGALYGIGLLVAHAIAGTDATVSLGSFPLLLALVTAIIGMLLGALGGRLARAARERAEARTSRELTSP